MLTPEGDTRSNSPCLSGDLSCSSVSMTRGLERLSRDSQCLRPERPSYPVHMCQLLVESFRPYGTLSISAQSSSQGLGLCCLSWVAGRVLSPTMPFYHRPSNIFPRACPSCTSLSESARVSTLIRFFHRRPCCVRSLVVVSTPGTLWGGSLSPSVLFYRHQGASAALVSNCERAWIIEGRSCGSR